MGLGPLTPAERRRTMGVIHVTITPGNPPSVSVDPIQVSKANHDNVVWHCHGPFKVQFDKDGTPFNERDFENGHPDSGRARDNAANGTYRYTVIAGGKLDPGVIIGP